MTLSEVDQSFGRAPSNALPKGEGLHACDGLPHGGHLDIDGVVQQRAASEISEATDGSVEERQFFKQRLLEAFSDGSGRAGCSRSVVQT